MALIKCPECGHEISDTFEYQDLVMWVFTIKMNGATAENGWEQIK